MQVFFKRIRHHSNTQVKSRLFTQNLKQIHCQFTKNFGTSQASSIHIVINRDMCNSNSSNSTMSQCSSKNCSTTPLLDIEDLHKNATLRKENTYTDPSTDFMVFTEYAHLKRGTCCGNACRHCPYGWEGVPSSKGKKAVRKIPKVRSGDGKRIQNLLQEIDDGVYFDKEDYSDSDSESDIEDDDVVHRLEGGEKEDEEVIPVSEPIQDQDSQQAKKSGGRHGGKYTSKNVPYTRSGDSGTSVLLTGERRSKDDISFEAMGTVDELCSVVGVVHSFMLENSDSPEEYEYLHDWLLDIMSRLFDIGSHVAKPKRLKDDNDEDDDDDEEIGFTPDGVGNGLDINHIDLLEDWIDQMTNDLPELTHFILPTGTKVSAQLHVARCVCRRAERRVLPLVRDGVCDPNAAKYLNRLSDFFFTAARWSNFCDGVDEVQYRRPIRGARQRNRVTVALREEKKVP